MEMTAQQLDQLKESIEAMSDEDLAKRIEELKAAKFQVVQELPRLEHETRRRAAIREFEKQNPGA